VLAAPLSSLTTLELGGRPRALLEARSEEDVARAAAEAHEAGERLLVLGGGSNIVVADEGVDARVLRIALDGWSEERAGDDLLVEVGAGRSWDAFTAEVSARGLQGVECLGGIPGQVGSTPIQNVGAYGQEVADVVEGVHVLELRSGQRRYLEREACQFGYRRSLFKQRDGEFTVTRVRFRLRRGAPPSLRYGELSQAAEALGPAPSLEAVRALVVELRRAKSMVLDPADENRRSCGSFFVNPELREALVDGIAARAGAAPPRFPTVDGKVKVPAAWLIERAGLERGMRRGAVGLSSKHTLCLVAHPGATARALVELAWLVRRRVEDAFGVTLHPEPRFWGFDRLIEGLPADLGSTG
jgi:UDP-N-acetylmuramate dehydrogenase